MDSLAYRAAPYGIPRSSPQLGESTVRFREAAIDEGFTLIEVLVAMVILAIGLLGLEALGIGAVRSIALADRQSGYATIASDSLESALFQLRQGLTPTQFCRTDLPFGDRLSREVDVTDPSLALVTVTVIPNPESHNAPRTNFDLSSSLYLPVAAAGVVQGAPCG